MADDIKFLLISIGTRGDIEPFLAIADLLEANGHEVVCAFPEQFGDLVEDTGATFRSLGPEFIDMLDCPDGKAVLGGEGTGLSKLVAYLRLARSSLPVNKDLVRRQQGIIAAEGPDRIVHNAKATYPILWGIAEHEETVLVSPVPYGPHATKERLPIGFGPNLGGNVNRLASRLLIIGMVQTTKVTARWLGINRPAGSAIRRQLISIPALYTISPTLFPRPSYWPNNAQVVGYHERDTMSHWQPSEELTEFIAHHDKILFVSFGSMTNPKPESRTKLLLDVLATHRIPAVIATGAGGLIELDEYDRTLVSFLEYAPYHWLLPKMYAAIHHGGSGTTHMTLKYGCATMIIPHIIDQFVWNDIVYSLGTGPKGPTIRKLTRRGLESKVLELWRNRRYKAQAETVSARMNAEDLRDEFYRRLIVDNKNPSWRDERHGN